MSELDDILAIRKKMSEDIIESMKMEAFLVSGAKFDRRNSIIYCGSIVDHLYFNEKINRIRYNYTQYDIIITELYKDILHPNKIAMAYCNDGSEEIIDIANHGDLYSRFDLEKKICFSTRTLPFELCLNANPNRPRLTLLLRR